MERAADGSGRLKDWRLSFPGIGLHSHTSYGDNIDARVQKLIPNFFFSRPRKSVGDDQSETQSHRQGQKQGTPGPLRLKSSPVRTPLRSVCAAACGFTLDRAGLPAVRNAPHTRFPLRRIVATTRALAVRLSVESLPRRPRSVWMTAPLKPLIQMGEGQGRGWKGRNYFAHDAQRR